MTGVDTNMVARLLTEDEANQAAKARALFERDTVLLTKTVLLVLRSLYAFERLRIAESLTSLLGLPNVVCEDASNVSDALQWALTGMDFADAMHLASARATGNFATFDRRLAKRARRVSDMTIAEL